MPGPGYHSSALACGSCRLPGATMVTSSWHASRVLCLPDLCPSAGLAVTEFSFHNLDRNSDRIYVWSCACRTVSSNDMELSPLDLTGSTVSARGPRGRLCYELVDGEFPELTAAPLTRAALRQPVGGCLQGHHGPIRRPGSLPLPSSMLSVVGLCGQGW